MIQFWLCGVTVLLLLLLLLLPSGQEHSFNQSSEVEQLLRLGSAEIGSAEIPWRKIRKESLGDGKARYDSNTE